MASLVAMNELLARFPGRHKEIHSLSCLLGKPGLEDPAQSVFLYGNSGTGKTDIVLAYLKNVLPLVATSSDDGDDVASTAHTTNTTQRKNAKFRMAYIHAITCFKPRLLFEHILRQLGVYDIIGYDKCEQLTTFMAALRSLGQKDQVFSAMTKYLVIDHAERLRDMGPYILPTLLRLSELTGLSISVILISNVTWERFRTSMDSLEPILLHFPDYEKDQILTILERDCPADYNETPADRVMYSNFIEIIYAVFHQSCRDLNEFRYLVLRLFPIYVTPILQGKALKGDTRKLYRHLQPYLKEALDKIYLRDISTSEWQDLIHHGDKSGTDRHDTKVTLDGQMQLNLEDQVDDLGVTQAANIDIFRKRLATPMSASSMVLPTYAKYILLASFLASYNPAKMDLRLFSHGATNTSRTKGGGRRRTKGVQSTEKTKQLLYGPKAFPVERMLAIFYNIVEAGVPNTIHIHGQIASLMTLRLLLKVSRSGDPLEGCRLKCNVSHRFIMDIGRRVGFDVNRYLYDFI